MNILLVNDDGIKEGLLHILLNALNKYGTVYTVVPNMVRSGTSLSFTLYSPIKVTKVEDKIYTINAYPADCVRIAKSLYKVDFDIVFSGINNGLNLGTDALYSGTVCAALEAKIEDIPAVAISADTDDYDKVLNELDGLLEYIFKNKLYSPNYVLNINFPPFKFRKSNGYKIATMGKKIFYAKFVNDDDVYNIDFEEPLLDTSDITDVYLADLGYITISPLGMDLTNIDAYKELKKYNQ